MEIFDVVNEYGEPTGNTVDRETAHLEGVRHRTSHLWLLRKKAGNTEILTSEADEDDDDDENDADKIPRDVKPRDEIMDEIKEELGVTPMTKDTARPEQSMRKNKRTNRHKE